MIQRELDMLECEYSNLFQLCCFYFDTGICIMRCVLRLYVNDVEKIKEIK